MICRPCLAARFRHRGGSLVAVGGSHRHFLGALTASPSAEDPRLTEALESVKRGRIDKALALAKELSTEEEPSRLLARACSESAAAAYAADREAREMAVGLAVAGSTFEIPGRDVTLIRPRQLVEGFWLRKISDQHEAAESLKRLAKAAVTLKGLDDEAVLRRLDEAPSAESSAAARDYQLLARSSVLRLQTSRSMAVLQAYIGKRIQGDGTVLPRLPTLWALFVKAGTHIRDALLSGEPEGPLSGAAEAPGRGPFLCGPFRRLAAQRQASVTRHMEILTELISESASTLFDADDGLDLLGLAEDFYKADCPMEVRQQTVKIFRATAATIRER